MSKFLKWGTYGAVALGLLIQLILYGRSHTNPPVTAEPNWDSERTRRLAEDACFSCHSNATQWPWYSHLAPMSWLIQRDVEAGRAALNLSEFDRGQDEAKDAAETVADGEMPPLRYTLVNPSARLSEGERRQLIRGLEATLGGGGRGQRRPGLIGRSPTRRVRPCGRTRSPWQGLRDPGYGRGLRPLRTLICLCATRVSPFAMISDG